MALLPISTISTDRFSYENGIFTAEASDLRDEAYRLHRLYDDACDEGIALKNPRTGGIVRFYLEEVVDRADELMAWIFRPIFEDKRRFPQIVKLIVYND